MFIKDTQIKTEIKNISMEGNREIIKIQSVIRKYLIKRLTLIPSSMYQTKTWRKARQWYTTGKQNECEKYQKRMLMPIIDAYLQNTDFRINLETMDIIKNTNPLKDNDGFEYTETFDGLQTINTNKIYYNLKFVCDAGGAQTRSLREVYHFIKAQLGFLMKSKTTNIYFINILDGDTSHKSFNKYKYLINQPLYAEIKKYIFIGDLSMFQLHWRSFGLQIHKPTNLRFHHSF